MPCSYIPHLQFKRISQQKIAISPDMLVSITSLILGKNMSQLDLTPVIGLRTKNNTVAN